jgi:hypothetical protein
VQSNNPSLSLNVSDETRQMLWLFLLFQFFPPCMLSVFCSLIEFSMSRVDKQLTWMRFLGTRAAKKEADERKVGKKKEAEGRAHVCESSYWYYYLI